MSCLMALAALAFVSAVVLTVVKKIRNPKQGGPRTWRALGAAIAFLAVYVVVCDWLKMKPGADGVLYMPAVLGVLVVFLSVRGTAKS